MAALQTSEEILSAPRWPGGPPICVHCNLPAFADWSQAARFIDTDCPSMHVQLKWHCSRCHCWHFWGHGAGPSGASSGTMRKLAVPQHIIDLWEETKSILTT